MGDLTKHFSRWEFRCRCGHCNGRYFMTDETILMLQTLRNRLRRPINIISGCRCELHPLTIARPSSLHAKGRAADIVISGMSAVTLAHEIFVQLFRKQISGLGVNWRRGTVHVDTRPVQMAALWSYRKDGSVYTLNEANGLLVARLDETREFAGRAFQQNVRA